MLSVSNIEIEKIRKEFPILKRMVNGKQLVYFDNGATSQKPQCVIDSLVKYYSEQNSNIHRGVHTLSREITELYEEARNTVRKHLNAASTSEIIFTKGTTESINLVAFCLQYCYLKAGDEIVISYMEHHSNILPWQQLRDLHGIILKVANVKDNGELDLEHLYSLFSDKTKILSLTHVSNTLGTINPVKEIIAAAHKKNIAVLIDGAQAVPHLKADVQDLDCDFYTFSAHKVYGPTGVGILYAKKKWLDQFPVYQSGGGTIKTVTFEKTEYAEAPLKFEAGTPHIEGGIGLATALNYINEIGLDNISEYENELLIYASKKLKEIAGLKIIGEAKEKAGVISFVIDGIHPFDLGSILDKYGIAVRTGHHCTQPLCQRFGIVGTVRISFSFYNT
ncbi:MAG: cysteine desulfurase, partial [Bacteroidia bacterium]|nr:cysteine desulfurase [Bacteroidia bacterium]